MQNTTNQKQEVTRIYSRYAREAAVVIGQLIRIHRIERKMSVRDLAERVGVSRDMIQRIEKGDMRCGIGLVFEAAATVGVPLFSAENVNHLTLQNQTQQEKLNLLPKAIHRVKAELKDDF